MHEMKPALVIQIINLGYQNLKFNQTSNCNDCEAFESIRFWWPSLYVFPFGDVSLIFPGNLQSPIFYWNFHYGFQIVTKKRRFVIDVNIRHIRCEILTNQCSLSLRNFPFIHLSTSCWPIFLTNRKKNKTTGESCLKFNLLREREISRKER